MRHACHNLVYMLKFVLPANLSKKRALQQIVVRLLVFFSNILSAYAAFFAFLASNALSVGFTITSAITSEMMYKASVAYSTY